jgi:predicted PolB exonuclease-like 3'-5' exonuclease
MDRISKLLGIEGKGDMDGSKVWPTYQAGGLTEIAHYCKGDVERARGMYKRMTFAA